MKTDTRPTENTAESGNKSKPLLGDVYPIKYEKEIDKLLKDLFYATWMDDEDYKEVIDETFKVMGITKQKLSDDIEIGVKNGHSLETQIALVKQILKTV